MLIFTAVYGDNPARHIAADSHLILLHVSIVSADISSACQPEIAAFAVHTWVAVKPENAGNYITYEIIGWRFWRDGNGLTRREGAPDRHWFGSAPQILAELRGSAAAEAIPQIEAAVAAYPFATQYRTWPGPNSNTFTAWVARAVPALRLDLPPTAVRSEEHTSELP